MRVRAVILGVLGGLMGDALGQGEEKSGELRLLLAWPVAVPQTGEVALDRSFQPTVVMRRTADGSVRSRYVLVNEARLGIAMEDAGSAALAEGLAACLKTGERQEREEGIWVVEDPRGRVVVDCGNGVVRSLDRGAAAQLVAMIGETRNRAKAFIGADWGLRREAIHKLKGPVLEGWSISLSLGSVDLPELGGLQGVWWQGESPGRFSCRMVPQDRAAPGAGHPITDSLLEALGRVPDQLARGESVRWESKHALLRAFPENRAIFYRPDREVAEDVRISMETVQEAWKVLERRDRMEAWFTKGVEPGLVALMAKGK